MTTCLPMSDLRRSLTGSVDDDRAGDALDDKGVERKVRVARPLEGVDQQAAVRAQVHDVAVVLGPGGELAVAGCRRGDACGLLAGNLDRVVDNRRPLIRVRCRRNGV